MDIGYQLRRMIEEKGITQKELAKSLNLSATTLNGYIQNRRQPDAQTLVQIAAYFDMSTDYIYGITPMKNHQAASFNKQERLLVKIFRSIPKENRPLFIEMGKTFCNFDKKNQTEKQAQELPLHARRKAAAKPKSNTNSNTMK